MRQWVSVAARSENSDDLPKGFYGGENRWFLWQISVAKRRLAPSDRAQNAQDNARDEVPDLATIPGKSPSSLVLLVGTCNVPG